MIFNHLVFIEAPEPIYNNITGYYVNVYDEANGEPYTKEQIELFAKAKLNNSNGLIPIETMRVTRIETERIR